ncbi:MAG TPA: GGDEF domain-containing protein [Myxococcales bacterium]|nr:GGDEF domain-containing protein [Myxococcales bacterium]HIK86438.1 GGDEF domain-containing protein [Myxococcales bacterium]
MQTFATPPGPSSVACGVPCRRSRVQIAAFDEQIEREVDLATLFGKRGCLLMVDIDHFKWVNDIHGHRCGDEVLKHFAATLSRCFMRRDDFVARYAGGHSSSFSGSWNGRWRPMSQSEG